MKWWPDQDAKWEFCEGADEENTYYFISYFIIYRNV